MKVSVADRDQHFRKTWNSVFINLPNGKEIEVNTDKMSFWNNTCRELICREIGIWFLENGHAPWSAGRPPTFELQPQDERYFKLHELEIKQSTNPDAGRKSMKTTFSNK